MNIADIRDVSIIDAFPTYECDKIVLDVGCGNGRVGQISSDMGYRVYATDYAPHTSWNDMNSLTFHVSDIFRTDTFPIASSPIVICSEVLEHLGEYRKAIMNLLSLTKIRLIITVPFELSFNNTSPPPKGHCNYWSDSSDKNFKNINEFYQLCSPYAVSISKIRTKPKDVQMGQWGYLIVVDKRQKYG